MRFVYVSFLTFLQISGQLPLTTTIFLSIMSSEIALSYGVCTSDFRVPLVVCVSMTILFKLFI